MRPRLLQKLTAPRADGVVGRARVCKTLERALRAGIAWVSAPAGYGKTSALADLVRGRAGPHVWYRMDEADQDVASFLHHMALTLRPTASRLLPVFGPEYADQPQAFARRFFRAYFARLGDGTLLVLDDLHHADVPHWRGVLRALLLELPEGLRCACLSRSLPPEELQDLTLAGRLTLVGQSELEFSGREARRLVAGRLQRARASVDVSAARGWAAGLVLLAERAATGNRRLETPGLPGDRGRGLVFAALARPVLEALTPMEQDALLKLCLLPAITPELATALTGSALAGTLLERLTRRQLLVTRGETGRAVFRLHDLLRDFLRHRFEQQFEAAARARLRRRAARALHAAGQTEDAVELALEAADWPLARRLMAGRAEQLLAEGKRATLIGWGASLPEAERGDPWLCYWLGVANMADDAAAEAWLARAWALFGERRELHGQCVTAARAVLAKTDSWRTHEGLAVWTRRLLEQLEHGLRHTRPGDQLLVWAGMLRAADFAEDYKSAAPAVARLVGRLLQRLAAPLPGDTTTQRLIASETVIEYAGSTGARAAFEQAVDSVAGALRDEGASPWALGLWLVAFGAVSGRYFPYARRGFPYRTAEQALRAALQLGEREALRGVEFGALYHLQLLTKLRGDLAEFADLTKRLAEIADSRNTTQVAVVADSQAALYTLHGEHAEAYRACERFMAAIEAADEPPIERWPHYITRFQVLLGDRQPQEAIRFLSGLLPQFDGEVRRRTEACVLVARACAARWSQAPDYPARLRDGFSELQALRFTAVLANLRGLLAELCADALELDVTPEFCRELIERRALLPPSLGCSRWPWALKVSVLGEFRLELDGAALALGQKAPTRSLDIVRFLAVSKDHRCALEELYEWLWPDADGDQAKAACEQALHRLRKLLGRVDLVLQRDGALRLSREHVFVDLDAWELGRKRLSRARNAEAGADGQAERLFWSFAGPLFHSLPSAAWSVPAAERVRAELIDLGALLAARADARGDASQARSFYLRALEFYPDSERCHEALARGRLAQGDVAGALDDYRRYLRILETGPQARPSATLRALMAPHLADVSDP